MTTHAPDHTLLFFVKHPAPGRVKSRLARRIGDEAACELYARFVQDMLDTIDRSGHPCRICVHPPEAVPAVSSWLGPGRKCLPQAGADLGERMEQAFCAAFREGAERVVLIGSDIPELPADLLHEALQSLDGHDAVLGPAEDGGYYLIGFRNTVFTAGVFHDIAWSTGAVLDVTMQRFRERGLTVRLLPPFRDMDTIDDLRDLFQRHRSTAFAESRTMVYLSDRWSEFLSPEAPNAQI